MANIETMQIIKSEYVELDRVKRAYDNLDLLISQEGNTVTENGKKNTIRFLKSIIMQNDGNYETVYEMGKNAFIDSNGVQYSLIYPKSDCTGTIIAIIKRYLLCKDNIELDIENCQPSIIAGLCNKHEIKSNNLNYYVHYRDEALQRVMDEFKISKREAKKTFLKIINNGQIPFKMQNYRMFNDLKNEMSYICENLKTFYPELAQHIESNNKENKEGSFISLLVHSIQKDIIIYAHEYLIENNIIVNGIHYDSIIINMKETEHTIIKKQVLKDIKKIMRNIFPGFPINFCFKKFSSENFDKIDKNETETEGMTSESESDNDEKIIYNAQETDIENIKDIIKNLSNERFTTTNHINFIAYTLAGIDFNLYIPFMDKLKEIENIDNLYDNKKIKNIFLKSSTDNIKKQINILSNLIKKDNAEIYNKYFNNIRNKPSDININHVLDEVDDTEVKYNNHCDELGRLLPLPQSKFMGIISPLGSGKTYQIRQYINKYYQNKKVLIMTGRVSLAQEFSRLFSDFEMYKDISGDINSNKLIIQVDSLFKLITKNGLIKKYDLIVLDEVELLLNRLCEVSKEDKQAVLKYFEYGMQKHTTVIAMDGFLTAKSVNLLESIRGQKMTIIKNTFQKEKQDMNINYDYKKTVENMIDDLKEGKKLYVVCNEKRFAESINECIKDLTNCKISMIHGQTDEYERAEAFLNLNEHIKKYDVLITTSVLLAGNSIDIKHFNKTYVFCTPNTNDPGQIHQMIKRVRHLKDNIINVCLSKMPKYEYITEFNSVKHWGKFCKEFKNMPENYINYLKWDEDGNTDYNKNLPYLLCCRYKFNMVNARTCFFTWFYSLAIKNYNVSFCEDEKGIIYFKKYQQIAESENIQNIQDADNIDDDEYKKHKKQQYRNKKEIIEDNKYIISKVYDIEPDDDIFNDDIILKKLMSASNQRKFLNQKFIMYTPETFDNFLSESLNKMSDDFKKFDSNNPELSDKFKYIMPLNKIMAALGYKNIMEMDKVIKVKELKQNYETNKKIIDNELSVLEFLRTAKKTNSGYNTWKALISKIKIYLDIYGLKLTNINTSTKNNDYYIYRITSIFDELAPNQKEYKTNDENEYITEDEKAYDYFYNNFYNNYCKCKIENIYSCQFVNPYNIIGNEDKENINYCSKCSKRNNIDEKGRVVIYHPTI